jgi:hypothetical protein
MTLLDEISVLLSAPTDGGDASLLERLEHTLTAGYARALALEAERWRLERRLEEAARAGGDAEELSGLAHRMSSTEVDLSHLRTLLASLRDRARAARAAAAVA